MKFLEWSVIKLVWFRQVSKMDVLFFGIFQKQIELNCKFHEELALVQDF